MSENTEKKAAALLDQEPRPEEADEAKETEDKKEGKAVDDPGEQIRKLCRGTLKLMHPFRAHGQDVKEIRFDFCDLTGAEMMDALDSVNANNMFVISNGQAMALFAATAEKCAPMVKDGDMLTRMYDKKDIKKRMGAADSVKAVQLAKLFYNASSQAGNSNISKD